MEVAVDVVHSNQSPANFPRFPCQWEFSPEYEYKTKLSSPLVQLVAAWYQIFNRSFSLTSEVGQS